MFNPLYNQQMFEKNIYNQRKLQMISIANAHAYHKLTFFAVGKDE